MSEQSCTIDTQDLLQSMLDRLKISAAAETALEQRVNVHRHMPPDAGTAGERSADSDSVTRQDGHIQRSDRAGKGDEDHRMELELLPPDHSVSVQPCAASVEDQGSLGAVPRWTRRPILPRPAALDVSFSPSISDGDSKMTLAPLPILDMSNKQYMYMPPGGHQELRTESNASAGHASGEHIRNEEGFAVLQSAPGAEERCLTSPLRFSSMWGARIPETTERTGVATEQPLSVETVFQNSGSYPAFGIVEHQTDPVKFASVELNASSVALQGVHAGRWTAGHSLATGNFFGNSRAADSSSENHLAYGPDRWNENKQGRANQNAVGGNFASMSDTAKQNTGVRDAAVTEGPAGTSKKKRRWVNGKTMRWAQRIRESWKEKHAVKKRETAKAGAREKYRENKAWEVDRDTHVNYAVQQSNRTDIFSDAHVQGEDSSSQTELGEHVDSASPVHSNRSSVWSDFELNHSPINLMDDIFTRVEWSNFLSPTPINAVSLSKTGTETWSQWHWTDREQRREESQANQSKLRASDHRQGEKNNNVAGSALQVPPPVAPSANENAAELSCVPSEAGPHAVESNEETEEPTQHALPLHFVKQANVLDSSALKGRDQLNRKREHHARQQSVRESSTVDEGQLSDSDVQASRGSRRSSGSMHGNDTHDVQLTGAQSKAQVRVLPLQCWDSEDSDVPSSPETVAKRRKTRDLVEDTRRVRFAEVLVTTIPCAPYDFEEELEEEEDEEEPRSFLPGWIMALKKKSRKRNL